MSTVYKTTTGISKYRSFTDPALDFTLNSDSPTPLAELDIGLQGPSRREPGPRVDVPRPFGGPIPLFSATPGTDGNRRLESMGAMGWLRGCFASGATTIAAVLTLVRANLSDDVLLGCECFCAMEPPCCTSCREDRAC
jgi:hypothetical protein